MRLGKMAFLILRWLFVLAPGGPEAGREVAPVDARVGKIGPSMNEPKYHNYRTAPFMCRAFIHILILALASTTSLFAQERDVSKWIQVPCPKDARSVDGILWNYSANYSKLEWSVYIDGSSVCSTLATNVSHNSKDQPKFTPEAEGFRGARSTLGVTNGWLVGFNHGEWGGSLYWFSPDGTANYKISEHQIVDFIQTSNGIVAIEGLAHLGMSTGSVICISRSPGQERWSAATLCQLPQAPYAITQHPDGTLLVVLSDSLVSVTPDGQIKTIVKNARWSGLYPNSVVLSKNAKVAYVGMRQFVARITLENGDLSFLTPDKSYLNKLPKDMEDRIRKTYGR